MDGENMGSRRPSRDHPWVTLNGHTSPTQATGQTPAPAVAAVEHRVSVAGADRVTGIVVADTADPLLPE
jgi:hypothetical protein